MRGLEPETFRPGRYFKMQPPPVKRPLRELTQRENDVVAERRASVHEMGKDAVDFVIALHKAGMIDGWRSVGEIVFFKEGNEHGTA